jgi:uncharacterized protein
MTGKQRQPERRSVAWAKDDPFGAEHADISFNPGRLSASGVAIGSEPTPYRLDYTLETTKSFVTTRLVVAARGEGWERWLELTRTDAGGWIAQARHSGGLQLPAPGGDTAPFAGALDPDLGLSPLFNSMPVLRHGLHEDGGQDFLMVWISVPDLSLHPSPQRYTHLRTDSDGRRAVRFESLSEDDDFAADIIFDSDGIVIDYPGIARRIRGKHG